MKNDGRACRRALPVPAPIAIGGGTGGQQAPRQGLLGYQELSRSRCEETTERIAKSASARGLYPRTPAHDCPGHAETGRSGASGDEKILRVKAGVAFPSLPLSQVYRVAGPPAPACRSPAFSAFLAGGCPGHAGSVGPERRSSIIPRSHRRMDQSMFVRKHFTPSHCGLSSRIA